MSALVDPAALRETAARWLAQDPDPHTRAELADLIDRATSDAGDAASELADRFDGRLLFGTAGLRGPLRAGSVGMNRVVVAQTAAGLAAYLRDSTEDPSIVIGYDARTNSRVFAHDTAEIMAGLGIRTTILPRETPTPVLAYAVRHLDASAGVMITASHNPATDNGVKVFLGGESGGSQIVDPQDRAIAASIARAAETHIGAYPRASSFAIADEETISSYIRRTAARGIPGRTPVRFVYTALHGVGARCSRDVFAAAGFGEPISVPEQEHPDASFPTVPFPNPEEEGVLDLAIELARSRDADLVIAHDPDADRLAVAIATRLGWRALTGNEIGLLLGWRAASAAWSGDAPASGGVLAASVVSAPGLAEIARIFGLGYTQTLTGFKHLSRVPHLRFGFEEALGYLVDPDKVRDKDGISAAVDFLSLAAEVRERGLSLEDRLAELAGEIGGYASGQVSVRVPSSQELERIMADLRDDPPTAIGASAVRESSDFRHGADGLPPSDLLRYELDGGARVIVRPSGTEPKIKAYIDVRDVEGTGAERLTRAQARVRDIVEDVRTLLQGSTS